MKLTLIYTVSALINAVMCFKLYSLDKQSDMIYVFVLLMFVESIVLLLLTTVDTLKKSIDAISTYEMVRGAFDIKCAARDVGIETEGKTTSTLIYEINRQEGYS